MSKKAPEPGAELALDSKELRQLREHTADMEAAIRQQISMLQFAQRKMQVELAEDLQGNNPVLHRDVMAKLASLTKAVTEASRAYVQYSKAAKSLQASMTPEERYEATLRFIEHQMTAVQRRQLRAWMLKEADTPHREHVKPVTAMDRMRAALAGDDPE